MSSELKLPKCNFNETLQYPQVYVNKQSEKEIFIINMKLNKIIDKIYLNLENNENSLLTNLSFLKDKFEECNRLICTELQNTHVQFATKFDKYKQTLKNINIKCDNISNIKQSVDNINIQQIEYNERLDILEKNISYISEEVKKITELTIKISNKLSEYEIEDLYEEVDEEVNEEVN